MSIKSVISTAIWRHFYSYDDYMFLKKSLNFDAQSNNKSLESYLDVLTLNARNHIHTLDRVFEQEIFSTESGISIPNIYDQENVQKYKNKVAIYQIENGSLLYKNMLYPLLKMAGYDVNDLESIFSD